MPANSRANEAVHPFVLRLLFYIVPDHVRIISAIVPGGEQKSPSTANVLGEAIRIMTERGFDVLLDMRVQSCLADRPPHRYRVVRDPLNPDAEAGQPWRKAC